MPLAHTLFNCVLGIHTTLQAICAASKQRAWLGGVCSCVFTNGSTCLHFKHKQVLLPIQSAAHLTREHFDPL